VKVGVYIFGIDNLSSTGASHWLVWIAAGSIILASLIAMAQDNLKKRHAYSTVSQLSYITLYMALASPSGAVDGGMHIVTHAFAKITLFMCAGSIYVATHKTEISDMRGLGREMPFTFLAFGIGAIAIIGMPPLSGSFDKWSTLAAAKNLDYQIAYGAFLISAFLNVVYLLPIALRGFFGEPSQGQKKSSGIADAPWFCVVPPVITALGCFVVFFATKDIKAFLGPIVMQAGG
ncbi:MAG: proton-conducting transporter membrane subunit, partial [Pseudomonadota bacterium]